MKKLYLVMTFVVGAIISMAILFSYDSHKYEKKMMEKAVLSNVDAREFANFKVLDLVTVRDDIKDSLLYYRMKTSWDECFLELYSDTYDEPAKRDYYKNEVAKDKERWDYFNGIMEYGSEKLNEKYITIYRISYLYTDESGNDMIEICDAKFKGRKMMEYKLNSQAKWVKMKL